MYFGVVSLFLVALSMNLNAVTGESDAYTMPDSCVTEQKSYCFEKGENYPENKIAELLKDLDESVVAPESPPLIIGSRNGGDSSDEPDCPSDSTEDPIYYIIDENGKVRVVVQSPEKFQQIYSVQWCKNEGRITNETPHFLKHTLEQFHMECVTNKMGFEFFVLSEDGLKIEIAKARGGIPVCCRCVQQK